MLPLANLSGDPSQEYFADGVTEALITELAKIASMRVVSRTSAMRYKGTTELVNQIARGLHVQTVLEGSVIKSGLIWVGLNDKERALRALEEAFGDCEPCLVSLKVEPIFDALRDDHRFTDMIRRVGLEP